MSIINYYDTKSALR